MAAIDRLANEIADLRAEISRRDVKPPNVAKRARPARTSLTPEQAHAIAKRKLARAGAVKSVR